MQFKQVLAVAALSQLVIAAPIAQSSNVLDDMLSNVAGAVSGTLSENGNGNQAGNDNKNNGNGNGNGNGDGAGSSNSIGNVNFKRNDWSIPTVGQAGSDCSISDVLTNTAGVVTGTLSCNGNGNSAGNGNVNNGNSNGNSNGDGAGSSNSIGNFNAKRNDAPSVGQAGSSCSISNWLTDTAGVVTGTLSCNGNGNSAGNGNEDNGNSNGNNNGQNAGSSNSIGNTSFKRSVVLARNSGWSSLPSVGSAGSDCQLSNVLQDVSGAVSGTLSCNGNGNSAGNGNIGNGNDNGNSNGVDAGSGNSIGNVGTSSKVRRQSVSAAYVNSVLSAANTGAEGVVSAALPADGATSSVNNAAGVVSNTLSGNGNGNSAGNGNTNNGNNNGNNNGDNSGNNNDIGNVDVDPTINF